MGSCQHKLKMCRLTLLAFLVTFVAMSYAITTIDNVRPQQTCDGRIELETADGTIQSAKKAFSIPIRRNIFVQRVQVYGNCNWKLTDKDGLIEEINQGEEKEINMYVVRGVILED